MENDPDLIFTLPLWWKLITELRRRGAGRSESGAFILGSRLGHKVRARQFVFYDDIDPDALKTGIVRLSGRSINTVWEICGRENMEVVADVHTHPGSSNQSNSDRQYPMVATRGHVALIIPRFARSVFDLAGVGHYRYRGAKAWDAFPSPRIGFFTVRFGGGQ